MCRISIAWTLFATFSLSQGLLGQEKGSVVFSKIIDRVVENRSDISSYDFEYERTTTTIEKYNTEGDIPAEAKFHEKGRIVKDYFTDFHVLVRRVSLEKVEGSKKKVDAFKKKYEMPKYHLKIRAGDKVGIYNCTNSTDLDRGGYDATDELPFDIRSFGIGFRGDYVRDSSFVRVADNLKKLYGAVEPKVLEQSKILEYQLGSYTIKVDPSKDYNIVEHKFMTPVEDNGKYSFQEHDSSKTTYKKFNDVWVPVSTVLYSAGTLQTLNLHWNSVNEITDGDDFNYEDLFRIATEKGYYKCE